MATISIVTDLEIKTVITPDDCVEELDEINNPPEGALVFVTYTSNPNPS